MRAGKRRHKVIIQKDTGSSLDDYGGPEAVWETHATVWVSIEPLRGGERFDAQRLNPEIENKIGCPYVASTTPKMRIKYGSRYMNILAVIDEEERHRELQLLCAEWVTV